MTHRVKDLSPEQKVAVESLLGQPVSEDDSVSIKALPSTAIIRAHLSEEQRNAALERSVRMAEARGWPGVCSLNCSKGLRPA
jgi:hypothetical protein